MAGIIDCDIVVPLICNNSPFKSDILMKIIRISRAFRGKRRAESARAACSHDLYGFGIPVQARSTGLTRASTQTHSNATAPMAKRTAFSARSELSLAS